MTLVWRPGFQFDADASTYIEAVEAADTQALETGVRYAINDFVIGCKQDGIWDAIKASCILAGARTRQGALVPLRNEFDVVNNIQPAAPQAFGFVDADYDRKTGLKGDGSTKYINSSRNNNADPQNSKHITTYISTAQTGSKVFAGNASSLNTPGDSYMFRNPASARTTARLHSSGTTQPIDIIDANTLIGFAGISRSSSSVFTARFNRTAYTSASDTSQLPISELIHIYKGGSSYADARLAFYSIGESLDLAKLDGRVTDLITAFQAPGVIP